MKLINLLPKASSLVEFLRDIGYSFESAIADIIDNSITAYAKNIKIYFDIDEDKNLSMAIIDDGIGMTKEELIEAMRPGGKNPLEYRDEKDLGRFGLGLKTASFSQCRKLTVTSSIDNYKTSAKWDLDFIAQTENWSLQLLDDKEISNIYKINSLKNNGTLVLWEETDRIIDNIISFNNTIIYEKMNIAQKHLELVFHRYLKGKNKINIFINDKQLQPFDPFHIGHSATQELSEEIIPINGAKIVIKPYILPHYIKISVQNYDYYAGEGGYLKNQGFYIYRNRRLLISGTWFRLISKSEMYKLARIQIDLPNSLDALWKIDVKKSNASPPLIIKNRLKKIIEKITEHSTRIYIHKGHKSRTSDIAFWERYNAKGEINYSINKKHPFIEKFVNNLDDEQKNEFINILDLIGNFFPKDALYNDLGNNNSKRINKKSISDIELEEMAMNKIKLERDLMNDNEFIKYFKSTEPFNIYTKNWMDFIENIGNL